MAATPVKRTAHRHEKLAQIYDDEVLPLFAQRFGQMLLRAVQPRPKMSVLELGCATGFVTLELLRRLDGDSRIIAIDPSSPLLDVARGKAGAEQAGKRIFFRTQPLFPRLAFADDVYDLVVSNLALGEAPDPAAAVRDFARVTRPGGQLVVTLPLQGTWTEFVDIYREVLQKHDRLDALRRLDDHVAAMPDAERAARWLEDAGLVGVEVEVEHWELLFRSAREFFYAPVIENGPLPAWKDIAGKGDEMQDTFYFIKEAIDAYFGGSAFSVGVVAGCVRGRKPESGAQAPGSGGAATGAGEPGALPRAHAAADPWRETADIAADPGEGFPAENTAPGRSPFVEANAPVPVTDGPTKKT